MYRPKRVTLHSTKLITIIISWTWSQKKKSSSSSPSPCSSVFLTLPVLLSSPDSLQSHLNLKSSSLGLKTSGPPADDDVETAVSLLRTRNEAVELPSLMDLESCIGLEIKTQGVFVSIDPSFYLSSLEETPGNSDVNGFGLVYNFLCFLILTGMQTAVYLLSCLLKRKRGSKMKG